MEGGKVLPPPPATPGVKKADHRLREATQRFSRARSLLGGLDRQRHHRVQAPQYSLRHEEVRDHSAKECAPSPRFAFAFTTPSKGGANNEGRAFATPSTLRRERASRFSATSPGSTSKSQGRDASERLYQEAQDRKERMKQLDASYEREHGCTFKPQLPSTPVLRGRAQHNRRRRPECQGESERRVSRDNDVFREPSDSPSRAGEEGGNSWERGLRKWSGSPKGRGKGPASPRRRESNSMNFTGGSTGSSRNSAMSPEVQRLSQTILREASHEDGHTPNPYKRKGLMHVNPEKVHRHAERSSRTPPRDRGRVPSGYRQHTMRSTGSSGASGRRARHRTEDEYVIHPMFRHLFSTRRDSQMSGGSLQSSEDFRHEGRPEDEQESEDGGASFDHLVAQLAGCGSPQGPANHYSLPDERGLPPPPPVPAAVIWGQEPSGVTSMSSISNREGALVLTGCRNGSISAWDSETGDSVISINAHAGAVKQLLVKGSTLLSLGTDTKIRFWDLSTFAMVLELTAQGAGRSNAMALRDDVLAIACGPDIQLLCLRGPNNLGKLEGHLLTVSAMVWVYPGPKALLASGSHDTYVRVWDTETCELVGTLAGHKGTVGALAATKDGKVISGGADGVVMVWGQSCGRKQPGRNGVGMSNIEKQSWDCLQELRYHRHGVWTLSCTSTAAGEELLVSGGGDASLQLWGATDGSWERIGGVRGLGACVSITEVIEDHKVVAGLSDGQVVALQISDQP
ncbi:unnamed protein product [Chrysoparadoxa australica]